MLKLVLGKLHQEELLINGLENKECQAISLTN
jgi:hypothetical protein